MTMLTIENIDVSELKGGSIKNTIYYDFREINFLSNSDIYYLINKLKEQDKAIQFVNVKNAIKNNIISLGLEKLIVCI